MKSNGACNNCKVSMKLELCTSIGEPVNTSIPLRRGYDDAEYSFFQCIECGSVWCQIVESGAGGHGKFFKRFTADMF